MSPNIKWYFANGKTPVGPLTFEELREKVVEGVLTSKIKVWHDQLGGWAYANRVPEVAAMIEEVRQERLAKPRWMVVVDKKAKRDTEGPFSDLDVEARLLDGTFLPKTIFWTKGQDGWLLAEQIPDVLEAKVRADAARAKRPPEIEDASDSPEIPDIPDEDGPPEIHDEEETSTVAIASAVEKPASLQKPFEPYIRPLVVRPEDDLARGLNSVFSGSRWLATVQVFMAELSKGIQSGDAIKIDGAVDKIRLFLLREVQPDRASRHPGMTAENLQFASRELLALVSKTEVKVKVDKFDPFFNLNRGGAPSITATRTRALLGAVSEKSFYPSES